MAFPKQNRLPLRKEFNRLKKEGQMIHGRFFSFLFTPGDKFPRFAVIVSKKIDKQAVQRNRIRRLINESVQTYLSQLKPIDGVFLVKKAITGQDFKAVGIETEILFKKARLLG